VDSPDIAKTPMPGGNPSAPASGSYGAKAAVDKLKQGMQSAMGDTSQAPPPGPKMSATPGAAKPSMPSGPAGLPAALLAPTQRPNEAVNTPPPAAPVSPLAGAVNAQQKRMALLTALAENPQSDTETRQWAKEAIRLAIAGSKR
jgi:hypothetical protein